MLYATVRQRKIFVKSPVTVIQNGVGVDWLTLDMDDEWQDMTSIVCVFTNGDTAKEVLHTFGQPVAVPWECLAETGRLSVSCTGYVGQEKVMTTMLPDSFWKVVQNGPVTGDAALTPTPSLMEQVLAAAGAAQDAADSAAALTAELAARAENGEFNGTSPTVEVGTVTGGTAAQVENVGTDQAVKLNFVLPRGEDGADGRGVESVTRDANGCWSITYSDGSGQSFQEEADTVRAVANLLFYDSGFISAIQYTNGTMVQRQEPTGGGSAVSDAVRYGVQTLTDAQKTQARANIGASAFSGSYSDLSGKPTSFTPASHTQTASTISAGTFTGAVKAKAGVQTAGTSMLRNSKLVAATASATPQAGEIVWKYE